jgi:hypothetical protein
MRIPYGISNFELIRTERYFYADKTTFLPELEERFRYLVFLRPRRFGKSTLVSMLEHYYDVTKRDRFDRLFQGLWIHEHPTAEQGSYLVLSFDFSGVATDAGPEVLRRSFVEHVRGYLTRFVLKYRDRVPVLGDVQARLDGIEDADALLGLVLNVVAATSHKVYVLIDEYDHFANRLLFGAEACAVSTTMREMGFLRTFFAALKSGTTGPVSRLFVTGVSPLMLDDVSSGFNIASQASSAPHLHALMGFTREETQHAVEGLLTAYPHLVTLREPGSRGALFDALIEQHDGYRFSREVDARVFNADMVLHSLRAIARAGEHPEPMLDMNERAEDSCLPDLGALSGADLDEQRALLQTILSEGRIRSDIIERFGVELLPKREAFLSLLYYLGMLTLGAAARTGEGYDLEIPNRTIRERLQEHLRLIRNESVSVKPANRRVRRRARAPERIFPAGDRP